MPQALNAKIAGAPSNRSRRFMGADDESRSGARPLECDDKATKNAKGLKADTNTSAMRLVCGFAAALDSGLRIAVTYTERLSRARCVVYPWIRLARSRLSLVGAKRVDPLSTTSVHLRVWPNDLDFNMHVNNGRYLTLADISRMHWFMSTGVWQVTRRHGAIPIVGDALAKFRRDLKVFERFEVQARMVGWNERWGFLEHRFIRNGRVLGVVAVRGVFKGPSGTIPPSDLMAELGARASSPALPKWIEEWNSGCDSLSELLRSEERERGIR